MTPQLCCFVGSKIHKIVSKHLCKEEIERSTRQVLRSELAVSGSEEVLNGCKVGVRSSDGSAQGGGKYMVSSTGTVPCSNFSSTHCSFPIALIQLLKSFRSVEPNAILYTPIIAGTKFMFFQPK